MKSGETLHGIAGKLRHEGVTLDMMVAGLYQANRGAFVGDNMNQLMHGSQLTVPDADSVVRQFSPAQASRLRREHAAAWEAYRVRLADQAGQQVLPDAVRPDAGRIETAARPAVPAAVAGGQDVLRLSKGALDRTADSEALQRIQALEEELLARGRALEDATGRIAQLERTVRDLQRLMVLQGAPVADEPAADGTAPVQVIPPAPVEAPAQLPAPLTPPAAESGWLSEFMQSPLRLAGLGLAALLLGVWFILNLRKRRRPALDLPAASLEPAAPFRATDDGDDASAGAEGPMTEPSRLDLGAIDTSEVDPLAEADVYLAYGRDAQAEEILKAAALRDPARHEIQLKLLGIYAGRLDRSAFEERARVLRASLGEPSGAIWLKAAEMGRGLDPANPLYALPAAVSMGAPGDTIEFEPEPLPAARPAALDLSAIDLELKMPSITEPISPSEPASPAETIEPLAGGSGGARADIKLDLAKAYFEMGDVGGALEILREVVVEGDARQRAEAQALLDARS